MPGSSPRLGLTGGIACGKSAVASMLIELGATVVDADVVAREVVEPGTTIFSRIVEAFGVEVLNSAGELDRPKLAAKVFADPVQLQRLNQITHPAIWAEILRQAEHGPAAGVREAALPVVLMIPLLYEHARESSVDEVWVVYVDEEEQIRRLMARNGYSHDEALQRLQAQWPQAKKVARAQVVIDNNGSLEETRKQVKDAWNRFVAKSGPIPSAAPLKGGLEPF